MILLLPERVYILEIKNMACHDLGFAASVLLSFAVCWLVAKWGVLECASSSDVGLCRDPHCRRIMQMVSCLIVLVWRVVGSTLILALPLTATNSVADLDTGGNWVVSDSAILCFLWTGVPLTLTLTLGVLNKDIHIFM